MSVSRRNWLQQISLLGAGSLLVAPGDVLALDRDGVDYAADQDMIRLSSNENPYSPSPRMMKAIDGMGSSLCRYPNASFRQLEAKIAAQEGVDPRCVVVTSGSREGLQAVGLIYGLQGGEISTCLPTYRALLSYAEHWGATLRVSPLTEDYLFNLQGIKDGLNDQTKMVFVCNPNNPTGTLLPAERLESFCREVAPRIPVFVDEVYFDYIEEQGYPSMKHLIEEGLNIIVARTLSKIYGLAGARIGYLMTSVDNAAQIRSALMSGTNVLGVTLANVALEDQSFKLYCLQKNKQCKQLIYATLDQLGLEYLRSHANFVFFKTKRDIKEVQAAFEQHGVLVGRAFAPYMDWCRVSTGKVEEVEVFVEVAKKVFA